MSDKHNHYKKDTTHLTMVDVYRVCDLFCINDPSGATQHAIKKLLLPGKRGVKGMEQDIREAIDTLERRLEMLEEDQLPTVRVSGVPYTVPVSSIVSLGAD